jgi:3'(2'), 5'-bisphosphate nucleotidase
MAEERMDDHELAAQLASEAGALLMALRQSRELEGAALGAAGDAQANRLLLEGLARERPDDAILSEESIDRPDRLHRERVWIVDPLDGTREYMEGRDDWAVHVALVVDGAPQAGAVAVPALGRLFASRPAPLVPASGAPPIMLVSRSRTPPFAEALAAHLGAEIRTMGSAGAKAAAVLAGEAQLYFHSGGQNEWDNCAPVAVALAAGLHASRIDGAPIRYNQADTRVPDLVIGQPDLAAAAVRLCRENVSAGASS